MNWGIQAAINTINEISCGSNRFLRAFQSRYPRGISQCPPPSKPRVLKPSQPKQYALRDSRSYLEAM